MYDDFELMKIWFYGFETIGHVTRRKLLERGGSIEKIFIGDKEAYKDVLNDAQYKEITSYCTLCDMKERVERLVKRNIGIIHYESDNFPKKLKNIYDPPGILYLKGRLDDTINDDSRNIAIVGSRNADTYGRELAHKFASELAGYGINIISGLALGIDGEAHRGALSKGRYTLAVLGSGINVAYPPAHTELFRSVEGFGGILSEHYLDVKPLPMNFPRRNRIISALSDGVLVVEAGRKSGSLITADFALEQGKQVYAIPGRLYEKNSEGTNNLIKQGAMCVTEPDDILMDLFGSGMLIENTNCNGKETEGKVKEVKWENSLAPTEKKVYSCLSLTPTHIDEIIDKVGFTVTEAVSCLYKMEKQGIIKQPKRGYYIISL